MNQRININRRQFIKGGAAATAFGVSGAMSYSPSLNRILAESAELAPTTSRFLKIGILGCERGSSHIDTLWGPLIHPPHEMTRVTGMTMTHVWDMEQTVAEDFAHRYQVPNIVRTFDEMVGKVDGIIMSGFKGSFWFHKLAEPYLKVGTPIFINRPFAYSIAHARRMIEIARANNTPVMCGDTHEYAKEVNIIRKKVEELKPLWGAMSDNSMSDYPSHGIHGLYFLIAGLGNQVRRVSYMTPDWKKPNGLLSLEYEPHPDGNVWYASQQQIYTGLDNAWIKIYGRNDFEQTLWWEQSSWDRLFFFFLPPLLAMQKMFETKVMPEPYENILIKTHIFLAGFKSAIERNGAWVSLAEVPEEWTAPNLYPDYIPKDYFG